MKKYNSYLVCAKTHVEIVTQTLLNQLGVAGKNTLLSFNNEKVEANFSKLYCSSTYLTKKVCETHSYSPPKKHCLWNLRLVSIFHILALLYLDNITKKEF